MPKTNTERSREWRLKNRDRYLEQRRAYERANPEKIRQYELNSRASHREDYLRRRADYKKAHPEVAEAHMFVNMALSCGTMAKSSCQICGSIEVDAHHEDYNRPFDVIWLCRRHHAEIHRSAKRGESG